MADLKISELTALAGANLVSDDELAIVDDSASETKKITVGDLVANGVTLISDDTIPGAKILFSSGDIPTAALADSAVTTAKIADDAVTAAKIADETTVDLVTTLPASGAFTGQLALDTDDNKLYAWDGSSWQSLVAPGSVNTVSGSTTGEINIVSTVSGDTVTISATLDNTTAAAQFLAGPVGSAGAVGYRAIDGGDLPTSTTTAKGGVIVNGEGLRMDSDTIEVDNDVTASSVHHVVTYDAKGLITGGRVIASSDLPIATTSARGAVIASSGLAVDASGNLSIDNTVTSGTYTKVTVTAQGVVSAGETLTAADIPDHSAAKLTSGTIGSSLIANDAVTAAKLADQSTMKFGGATGTDGVTIFPTGDFQGQLFFDETSEDLYFYSGSAFVPITVISGNLVNAGTYNASTNLLTSVTTLGSGAGFTAGSALPSPSANNLNHYVVVDTSGTGTGAAPGVALAPPDMLLSQGVGTEFALVDVSNAIAGQTASNISVVATGNIVATDVQAALVELDNEKVAKAGDTMTGDLNLGDGVVIVFEGSTANDYETTLTVTDPTADRTITLPDVTGTVVTTGDTGSVTSTMITDGTIVNADISSSAEIAVSKLANGTARQLLQTAANGTDVEFTSNVDVPGTLDVTGAATFDSTLTVTGLISADGKVSFPAGTAAAPSIYSGSDTDTGIYSPGSNQFGITTNGTSRVVVDSSGNVGIGTSPSAKLHVSSTAGVEALVSGGGTSGDTVLHLKGNGNAFKFIVPNTASQYGIGLYDVSNTTYRMFVDSSGNLGVGESSPDQRLHVKTSSDDVAKLESTSGGNGPNLTFAHTGASPADDDVTGKLTFNATNDASQETTFADIKVITTDVSDGSEDAAFAFSTRNNGTFAERLRVDSAGRILAGTTTTGGASTYYDDLVISNTDSGTGCGITLLANATNGFNAIDFGDTDAAGRGRITYSHADDSLRIDTAGTQCVHIDSSGRLGLGNTSANSMNSSMNNFVLGSGSGSEGMVIYSGSSDSGFIGFNDAAAAATQGVIEYNHSGNYMGFRTADSEKVRIDSSGRLLVGTSSARTNVFTFAPALQVEGTTANTSRILATRNSNSQGAEPSLILAKSRGTSNSSNTIVQNGDRIGALEFSGADGANFISACSVRGEVDGTPGTDDMPGRLVFSTTADGASSPTEAVRIDSSGRLLCGTSSNYGLTTTAVFSGLGGTEGIVSIINDDDTFINTNDKLGTIKFGGSESGGNAGVGASIEVLAEGPWSSDVPARIEFNTVQVGSDLLRERMRIHGSGGVSIGDHHTLITSDTPFQISTTSGRNWAYINSESLSNNDFVGLYARGEVSGTSRLAFIGVRKHSGITNAVGYIFLDQQDGGNSYFWADDSGVFRTSSNNDHAGTTSGTVVGTQTSDERLKNVGAAVSYGLAEVKQLQPKQYALKTEPDTNRLGFIAQEVESIIPEAVFDTKEELEGHEDGDRTKLGMEYVQLIPVLVNAIKELSAENADLAARIAALEAA